MTLRQFQAYLIAASNPDKYKQIMFILQAMGKSMEEIKAMPWGKAIAEANQVIESVGKEKSELATFLILDGVKYGLHPDIYGMTTGEYVDLGTLSKEFWPDAHKYMAVLYRPVTEERKGKYAIEKYTEAHMANAPLFFDVDMGLVRGLADFFLTLSAEFNQISLTFSQMVMTDSLKEAVKQTRGRGIKSFIKSQARSVEWTKLLSGLFMPFLRSYTSKGSKR